MAIYDVPSGIVVKDDDYNHLLRKTHDEYIRTRAEYISFVKANRTYKLSKKNFYQDHADGKRAVNESLLLVERTGNEVAALELVHAAYEKYAAEWDMRNADSKMICGKVRGFNSIIHKKEVTTLLQSIFDKALKEYMEGLE